MFGRILENADVFMSQEDLALSIWTPRLRIWVSVSDLVTSFDVNLSTLWNGAKECIPAGAEREDSVP